jgi:hypothetical protein
MNNSPRKHEGSKTVFLASIVLLSGCAPGPPSPLGDACLSIADTTVARLDTVVVALTQAEGAEFLSRHLSSNLVRLDCAGEIRPDRATRWTAEDGGKTWVFTLGTLTAGAVRESWDAQRNGGIWPWPAMLAVEVLDSARLRVRLDRAYHELPAEFGDSWLAVAGGSFRTQIVAHPPAGPVTSVSYLAPLTGPGPVIKVELLRPNVDPRDALDFPRVGLLSPADVVITSDAATVAYARSRREFIVSPVAWSLTYVLLTPVPGLPATTLPIDDETRRSLVRDVVPGEVRAALAPFWWDSLPCQSTTRDYDPSSRAGPILAFDRSDPIARALAERLAAMTISKPGAHTLPVNRLLVTPGLFTGIANAFVLSLPRQRRIICDPQWPKGSRMDALIDLQAFVIARRGVQPLLLDGDGMIRFNPEPGP